MLRRKWCWSVYHATGRDGRLFALDKMAEGPFPEHYEPIETPLDTNPLHPKVVSNPAARVLKTTGPKWVKRQNSLMWEPLIA